MKHEYSAFAPVVAIDTAHRAVIVRCPYGPHFHRHCLGVGDTSPVPCWHMNPERAARAPVQLRYRISDPYNVVEA